jgi:peptidoglycan/LPS O-acetylase OafA/YrhL
MKTLDQCLNIKGTTSGFDYMRLILAFAVVMWHSAGTSYGLDSVDIISRGWVGYPVFMIMPLFFALSGFLVSTSLLRSRTLVVFMGLRGLRIFPALCVEIFLSALLIGPLLTSVHLKTYFSDHDFHTYFLNILGEIHYNLPGVFSENPIPNVVNASLWTIPFEMQCYISLFVLAILGIAKRPKAILAAFLIISIGALIHKCFFVVDPRPVGTQPTGTQLILFFLGGVTLFMWRDKIPHSFGLFIASLIVSLLLIKTQRFIYLTPLPVAYMTAYMGLLTPRKLPVLFSGDYSYGVYLYAFPIQQAVSLLSPPQTRVWYLNFLISLVPVGLFAAFSWHCIEKPMLKFKRLLTRKPETPKIIQFAEPEDEAISLEPVMIEDEA